MLTVPTRLSWGVLLLPKGSAEENVVARPKEIEAAVRVSTVVSRKQLEWVKHMAIQMSAREGRQITTSEAIRMAIEGFYRYIRISMTSRWFYIKK